MQNLETAETQPVETKKFSKRDYNRAYYQQRKLMKSLAISKAQPSSETSSLNQGSVALLLRSTFCEKSWKRILIAVEILLLLMLTSFMTALLVKESASFYLDSQEAPWIAYLKAGMIETIAILFSFSRSKCKALRWGQKGMVLMLCLFTLSLMSGKAIKTASTDTLKVEIVKQTLRQLEVELAQKENLRNEFLNKGWLSMTRRYEKAVDKTRNKLTAARNELCALQSPVVIAQNLRILIAFRVLLVIANLVCIHRIAELFGSDLFYTDERRVKKMSKLMKKVSESV